MPYFRVIPGRVFLVMYDKTTKVKKMIPSGEVIELKDINEGGQAYKLEKCKKPSDKGPTKAEIEAAELAEANDAAQKSIARMEDLIEKHSSTISDEMFECITTAIESTREAMKNSVSPASIHSEIEKIVRFAEEVEKDPNIASGGGSVEDAKKLLMGS